MCESQNLDHDAGLVLNLDRLLESHLAAKVNQIAFETAEVTAFHLMGNAGSGKTRLLERTLERLSAQVRSAVIQGQIATELDADRFRLNGTPTLTITTGQVDHLDAESVADVLKQLRLNEFDYLWIENVGNLSAPAKSPLGTHKNVLLISIADGEELPLKYPALLRDADCVLITKVDLLPHLQFDLGQLIDNIEQINPQVPIFDLSAESGEGMDLWMRWLSSETNQIADEEVDMNYEKPVYVPFIG